MNAKINSYLLEDLAKHHEQTQSIVHRYVTEADYLKLKAERDALTAQAETVKSLFPLNCLVGCNGMLHYPVSQYNKVVDALNAAPQQHLAEIRAQAGRAGFVEGVRQEMLDRFGLFYHDTRVKADRYADSIRRGEVK